MPEFVHRSSIPAFGKACIAGGLIAMGALQSSLALAVEEVDEFGPLNADREREQPSEQSVAVELRFGPYLPKLPNVQNATPSLGKELGHSHRVLVGLEADWQALRIPKVLSLGPGAGMAYTRLHRSGTYDNIGYDATLKVLPMWLLGVLKVDVLQQRWEIPLVFSAKFGAARASWWTNESYKTYPTVTQKNSGSAQGLAWALGAMLDLGILDRARARHLDEISGVNHMYLFGEWFKFKLDDFGNGTDSLGDSTWVLGFAVDM